MKQRVGIFWLGLVMGTGAMAQQLDVDRIFEERNLGPVAKLLEHGEYDLCARICEQAISRNLKAVE